MNRRNIFSLALAASIAVLGPVLTTQPAAATDKIKVGVFLSSSALPYFIAINRGYFKDVDIEVETIPLATHPLIVQSLVTGAIDIGTNLVTLEGANINARRPDTLSYISLNGQNAKYITEQFVVKASSEAKSLKDLKGMKLFSAPGPANLGAAKAVLKAVGLEENTDYTIQEQQLGVQLGALQAGTFDGGYTLEPIASMMIAQNIGKRVEAGVIATYLLGNKDADAFAAGCALSNAFIKERPDVAKRFAQAWARGFKDATNDPSAREYLAQDMKVPPTLSATVPLARFLLAKDMTPADIENFQKFVDIGTDLGVVNGKVDVKTMLKPM
jgi:NitT/TauT family transport system substrate-binding protein